MVLSPERRRAVGEEELLEYVPRTSVSRENPNGLLQIVSRG
jgi:hypothetical protein